MSDLRRVLVLAGGLSYERDVSLRSGRRVADALKHCGVDAHLADVDADLLPGLRDTDAEAVFIALHGGSGEDGAIRGILDCAGVPYVGTGAHPARIAFDKPTAKELVRRVGISTPAWVALSHATFRELGASEVMDTIAAELGLPLVVKPAAGGSALGVSIVRDVDDLPGALVSCYSYGDTAMLERYIAGTEVAVSVIEPEGPGSARALPIVEIRPESGFYDYAARYTAGATEFHVPARLDAATTSELTRVAVAAHNTLLLRDLSRTDAIIDADGAIQFLEVTVSPGMTETSLLPMAVAAEGLDLGRLVEGMLLRARDRAVPAGALPGR